MSIPVSSPSPATTPRTSVTVTPRTARIDVIPPEKWTGYDNALTQLFLRQRASNANKFREGFDGVKEDRVLSVVYR